jgi:beta-glucuronidase
MANVLRYRIVWLLFTALMLSGLMIPTQPTRATPADVYTSADVATLPATVSLQTHDGIAAPFAYNRPLPSLELQPQRPILDLAGTWKKERVTLDHDLSLSDRTTALARIEQEGGGRHLPNFDDSAWATKTLPNVENELTGEATDKSVEPYEDGVWYRRTFSVDSAWQGKQVRLVFQAVNYVADVWVNGVWVGYHEGGYTPFALDVTAAISDTDNNTIAVRVDNPPWDSRTDIVPAVKSDWWNYTGVIQDVYLEQLPTQYVARADVRPLDTKGRFQTNIVLYNAANTTQSLSSEVAVYNANVTAANLIEPSAAAIVGAPAPLQGRKDQRVSLDAAGTQALAYDLRIPSPKLWSPAEPNLYVLKVTLRSGNTIVDEFCTQFGIRTVALARNSPHVLLNERPVYFTGMARHEDWIDTGRTIGSIERIKADLEQIKSINVNFLRTAHYPNHPYTYLLTDRMGLAVAEEIPTWWFDAYHFADQKQRGIADQMWREMIFRDYNRPSILLWSGTNESIGNERRREFLTRINRDLKQNYYDGRLVTQSASTSRGGPADPTMNAVDVAGWTTYFGIFAPGPYYEGTRDFLTLANNAFPNKPIFNTEFGYWSTPDGSLQLLQREVFNETYPAFEERRALNADGSVNPGGFMMTQTWWAAFDWFTVIAGLNTFGTTTMDRETQRPVRAAIQERYAPYHTMGGLAKTRLPTREVEIPEDYLAPQPTTVPALPVLQDFESPESFYDVFRSSNRLDTTIVHSGKFSLKMVGTGEFNGVGAYLYQRPVDASAYSQICVWAYDTQGNNVMRLRLLDSDGGNQEIEGPATSRRGEWTELCFNLSAFDQINVAKLAKVQFTMQPGAVYYFDDLRLK